MAGNLRRTGKINTPFGLCFSTRQNLLFLSRENILHGERAGGSEDCIIDGACGLDCARTLVTQEKKGRLVRDHEGPCSAEGKQAVHTLCERGLAGWRGNGRVRCRGCLNLCLFLGRRGSLKSLGKLRVQG